MKETGLNTCATAVLDLHRQTLRLYRYYICFYNFFLQIGLLSILAAIIIEDPGFPHYYPFATIERCISSPGHFC